jgi:hypothetical protein
VPLVLISDFLSVTMPNHFSVVLGLVLLGIVFLIPNGLVGLLGTAREGWRKHDLAQRLSGHGLPRQSMPRRDNETATPDPPDRARQP